MNTVTVAPLPATVRQTVHTLPVYSSHLDLLRGVSALIVMVGHLRFMLEDIARKPQGQIPWDAAWKLAGAKDPVNMMNPPHQAVIVFFVLSGALVGGSVLRDYNLQRFSWLSYTVKRLSRLLTVLIPALVLGTIIDLTSRHIIESSAPARFGRLSDTQFHLGAKAFFTNLLFLQILDRTRLPSFGSNTALWSLSAEFWYYVLFPLCVAAIFTRPQWRRALLGASFLMTAWFLWKNPFSHFLIWVMGAITTLIPLAIPERHQRKAVFLAAIQFGGIGLLLWKHPFSNRMFDDYLLGFSISILLYGILHRREVRPIHAYGWLARHMAEMSFTLYLFHLPLLILIVLATVSYTPAVIHHHGAAFAAIGSMTYGICYLLYLLFERNTDRVKTSAMKMLHGVR